MGKKRFNRPLLTLTVWLALAELQAAEVSSEADSQQCSQVTELHVIVKSIYDDEEDWFKSVAHGLKITTSHNTVKFLLPFAEGDWVCPNQVEEAKVIIRRSGFVSEPEVSFNQGVMRVTVRDLWTLFPSFSLTHSGGKSSRSLGVREANLMGQGIASTIRYEDSPDSKGYRFRLDAPLRLGQQTRLQLVHDDFEEGFASELALNRPFYTLETERSMQVRYSEDDLKKTIFHNEEDEHEYFQDAHHLVLGYGWKLASGSDQATRFSLSVENFSQYPQPTLTSNYQDLTREIEKNTISAELQWYQQKFHTLKNVHIIHDLEDINLGHDFRLSLGLGEKSIEKVSGKLVTLHSRWSKYWHMGDFILANASNFYSEWSNQLPELVQFNQLNQVFYPVNEDASLYFKVHLAYLSHFYAEVQESGDTSGARGFPLGYQHGRKKWASSIEYRRYTQLNWFDSFAVGAAVFLDAAKAWDLPDMAESGVGNQDLGTLYSIGVGLRFFPHVAAGSNVVHIDLVRPYSDHLAQSSFEFRALLRSSF